MTTVLDRVPERFVKFFKSVFDNDVEVYASKNPDVVETIKLLANDMGFKYRYKEGIARFVFMGTQRTRHPVRIVVYKPPMWSMDNVNNNLPAFSAFDAEIFCRAMGAILHTKCNECLTESIERHCDFLKNEVCCDLCGAVNITGYFEFKSEL